MSSLSIISPGVLSLIQDKGRYGYAHMGIATGGVADAQAYYWLNRLLQHSANAACVEITLGGFKAISLGAQVICVTGADMPLTINGKLKRNWCCHAIVKGDVIELGYAKSGLRAYLGIQQGFSIEPQFNSCSTVVRERIGGLSGQKLKPGDELTFIVEHKADDAFSYLALGDNDIPRYHQEIVVRVVLGYQHSQFTEAEKKRFFSTEYHVSKEFDRMGYRLTGPNIKVDMPSLKSEGICYGAIQIPPDGQPIVLLNDRQTLGGYPKLGSILSIDGHKLAQCNQGASIRFIEISPEQAGTEVQLVRQAQEDTPLKVLSTISA